MSQERGDLSFVEIQREAIYSQLFAIAINLHQVLNGYTKAKMTWLFFHTDCGESKMFSKERGYYKFSQDLLVLGLTAPQEQPVVAFDANVATQEEAVLGNLSP